MFKWALATGAFGLVLASGCGKNPEMSSAHRLAQADGHQIVVETKSPIRDVSHRPLGINLNYLHDKDTNRKNVRPLTDALSDMGVHFLRYPGGEKSDFHMWSTPPWDAPRPQVFGWYSSQAWDLLNFDEYMAYARSVGGEPYIVVGYDNSSRTGKSKQEFLTNAVEWVRYANVKKKYNVKYWEIGNENWNNNTGSAAELGSIVSEFARAMKAVDPTIKVGTSGNSDGWWSEILKRAGGDIDFLVTSNYPSVQSYESYRNNPQISLQYATSTAAAIEAHATNADKKRIKVVAAEFNAIDWSKKWKDSNDLGHALVNFDMFGQLLKEPRLDFALFWTTRWVSGNDVFNALNDQNNLNPQGNAIKIWGRFFEKSLVRSSSFDKVVSYATFNPDTQRVIVYLINKDYTKVGVSVVVSDLDSSIASMERWEFTGKDPTDYYPSLSRKDPVEVKENKLTVELAPLSVTVLDMKP